MPRSSTLGFLQKAAAIVTMAVVALWGGGKPHIETTGSTSSVERQTSAVLRSVVATQTEVVARTPVDEVASAGSDRAAIIPALHFDTPTIAINSRSAFDQPGITISVWIRPPTRAPPLAAMYG